MFSQFYPKATKSRSRGVFSFAMRKNRLLQKTASGYNPLVWLLAFMGQKSNQTDSVTEREIGSNLFLNDFGG
jgi:hypothetical protein